jgi:ParB-like chromosome segregation protein Spo0J
LLKSVILKIDEIYVPAARRKELDPRKLEDVAEQIMDEASSRPIQVRKGDGRYVLIKGIHRLEAHRALGDKTIETYVVSAVQH